MQGESGSLVSRFAEITADLAPGWLELMDVAALRAALAGVDAAGDSGATAPPPELILEALRYGSPGEIEFVVIGQDPFPTPGDAEGLCFSTGAAAVPESLKRIYGCLRRGGLMKEHPRQTGSLHGWAVQGGLLLNRALTTRKGGRNAHQKHWKEFTSSLVRALCARARAEGRELVFLLWGGNARELAPLAQKHGHVVKQWSHPSPLIDNKLPEPSRFVNCPHFEEANAALRGAARREIVWDPAAASVIFCDGSCLKNGCPDAVAGFGVAMTGGPGRGAQLTGGVEPYAYAFVGADPLKGFAPAYDQPVRCTNNRAEFLALCWALTAALRSRAQVVEVVSDSNDCVKTLASWLPARRAKGTAHQLQNLDLVVIAEQLYDALRERALSVTLTHYPAHMKAPRSGDPREKFLWRGNKTADDLAGEGSRGAPERFECRAGLPYLARALRPPAKG